MTTKLTKAQLGKLAKWDAQRRMSVSVNNWRWTGDKHEAEEMPEWALNGFWISRELIELALIGFAAKKANLLPDCPSVFDEVEANSIRRVKAYREGNRKAWITRKKAARAQAPQEPTGDMKAA